MFTKKFGVEIEFTGMNPDQAARYVRASGLDLTDDYDHGWNSDHWVMKSDGSVHGDSGECDYPSEDGDPCGDCDGCYGSGEGCELVSPPIAFSADAENQIRAMVSALQNNGAYTNDSCGLHVHVNATFLRNWHRNRVRRFFAHLWNLYGRYEHVFDARMNDSRYDNQYCLSVRHNTLNHQYYDRYRKLNLTAFARHGTIEFRHHHGTLDADAIISWVKTCLLFFNIAKETFKSQEVATEFFSQEVVSTIVYPAPRPVTEPAIEAPAAAE